MAKKDQIKFDIGDKVLVKVDNNGKRQELIGTISLVLLTKNKIMYRANFGHALVRDFLQEDILTIPDSEVKNKYDN